MLLNLHEFAFEGQNLKFAVNMLLTCITSNKFFDPESGKAIIAETDDLAKNLLRDSLVCQ